MWRLLPILTLLGLLPHSARAQCPPAIPAPATAFHVTCFTTNRSADQRCATAIEPTVCDRLNDRAYLAHLLTVDGYQTLQNNGFCAMAMDYGEGLFIYDFCPRGCFAADSRILTGISAEGEASYAAAASVTHETTLLSVADGASFDDLAFAPQAVKRTVYGPEDDDLFVFALANGSSLRVTRHHPMVLDTGKIIEAGDVGAEMSFVGLDGSSVAITAITREPAVGDVFNFETAGATQLGHIIVAEGVLVGDLKLQNELENEGAAIDRRR